MRKHGKGEAAPSVEHFSDNPIFTAEDIAEALGNGDPLIDILKIVKGDYERAVITRRQALYLTIMVCCTIGDKYGEKHREWEAFAKDAFWETQKTQRPDPGDAREATRYVLKYVFSGTLHGPSDASMYWRAVQELRKGGVSNADMPAAIESRGGLKQLAETFAKGAGLISGKGTHVPRTSAASANAQSVRAVEHSAFSDLEDFVECKLDFGECFQEYAALPDQSNGRIKCDFQKRGRTIFLTATKITPRSQIDDDGDGAKADGV